MYPKSGWEFTTEVSKQFNEHVKQSVPHYERIHEHIAAISDFFISNKGFIYDLGTATGESIRRIHKRHPNKDLNFIGIDCSEAMILQAIEECNHIPGAKFEQQDLLNYQFKTRSSLIVSVLTLQFLSIQERKKVIDNIFQNLEEGGAFILVEKVISPVSVIHDMFTHIHYEYKQSSGLSPEEILLKEQSLRGVMKPISLNENIRILTDAGFQAEVFFKEWQFTGIVAIKPML